MSSNHASNQIDLDAIERDYTPRGRNDGVEDSERILPLIAELRASRKVVEAWDELRADVEKSVLESTAEYPNFEGGYDSGMEQILKNMDALVPPPDSALGEWVTTPWPSGKGSSTDYRRKAVLS